MDTMASESTAAEEDESPDTEAWCLTRVGRNVDWLHLFEKTEITIGRGVDVTYQLISPSCPLMISRLHCIFKQREDGHWTVTDRKSVNGVSVNGNRIPADRAYRLRLGDSIQLGVDANGNGVEHEYVLVRRPLKDMKANFATVCNRNSYTAKRKFNTDDTEPSTSSNSKHYRGSPADRSCAQTCPAVGTPKQKPSPRSSDDSRHAVIQQEEIVLTVGPISPSDLDNLQMYSQNILTLRERVSDTQKRVASLDGAPQQAAQVRELQSQLGTLRDKMQKMESLERTFSQTRKQLEAQKTKQQEDLLKKQLEEALQEQKKVMEELAHSRQDFQEVLLAKNKELELTKEEKEKERAQKEEVVTQVTEVLENELQCIICSELFIEAVILNCAHSFCLYCISEWRKRKNECPICRQMIRSQTRCLALDNCIEGMVKNLSLDTKARRQAIVTERKATKPVEVMVIHDDSSSSSHSDPSRSSVDSDSEESVGTVDSSSVVSLGSGSSFHPGSSSPASDAFVEDDVGDIDF